MEGDQASFLTRQEYQGVIKPFAVESFFFCNREILIIWLLDFDY